MKLNKKKNLAAKVLKVGKGRIMFDNLRLEDIKDVITRQDIRDLKDSKVIKTRAKKGHKKVKKRKTKRKHGKIKKKVKRRKREYVIITRKLRNYIKELKKQGKIDVKQHRDLRKKIKARFFKNKNHLKEYLTNEK